MVDDVMCSANCKCDNTVAVDGGAEIESLSNLEDYGSAGRGTYPVDAPIPFVFEAPADDVYSTYNECYEAFV